ncbi:MAG: helix-turn-helix transcriptional regulator [Rickettsiales bacterium]|nr:helix-turn-helix transcriptional regulator [Rickettsiales bacterium]
MIGNKNSSACPAEITISLIGNKWKLLILRELSYGVKRFGELMRIIDGISQKVLTQSLRTMEDDGLVKRKVYPEVPPKVEYSMSDIARDLSPILDLMGEWGIKYNTLFKCNETETHDGED